MTYSFYDAAHGSDVNWTATQKSDISNGFDNWEAVRSPYGGSLVDVVKLADNGVTEWKVVNDNYGDGFGAKVTCSGGYKIIFDIFDPFQTLTRSSLRGLATHEMGHGLDLAHAGDSDSWDSSYNSLPTEFPSMGTCSTPSYSILESLEQDDYANLEWRYTSQVNSDANTSFETGSTRFWGLGGGASGTVVSGGASDGSYYLRLYGYGGYLYQTVRVTDPKDMRARVNFKKYYSSSSGQIFYGIYARSVYYPNAASGSCMADAFKNGWDLNNPSVANTTFTYRKGKWASPTTSWQWPDTAEWTDVDSWRGVDARLYIYNYMKHSGSSTYVRIDHARIRNT